MFSISQEGNLDVLKITELLKVCKFPYSATVTGLYFQGIPTPPSRQPSFLLLHANKGDWVEDIYFVLVRSTTSSENIANSVKSVFETTRRGGPQLKIPKEPSLTEFWRSQVPSLTHRSVFSKSKRDTKTKFHMKWTHANRGWYKGINSVLLRVKHDSPGFTILDKSSIYYVEWLLFPPI